MTGGVVGKVGEGDRSLVRKSAVLVEFIACGFEEGACFFESAFVIVVDCVRIIVALLNDFGLEYAAVAVSHAVRNECVSGFLTGLTDVLTDVVTVNKESDSFSHAGCFFGGLAVEEGALAVECCVISTEVVNNVELGIAEKGSDLVGRNGVCEVDIACVICSVDSGIIVGEHELEFLNFYVFSIPIIGVLYVGHRNVVAPAGANVSAVGNEAGILSPFAGSGGISVGFNGCFVYGEEGRECHEVLDVCARSGENELKGYVVNSGYCELVGVANKAGEHIAVVGSGLFAGCTFPGVLEISSGERIAVGPFEVGFEGYGVGKTVLGNGVALCAGGRSYAVCVVGVKTGEGVCSKAGAVNGAVESRVEVCRLGGKVKTESVGAVAKGSIHKEFGAEEVCENAFYVIFLEIDVVVEIEGDYAVVGHKNVLSLMHKLGTLCIVGAGFDFVDKCIILCPVLNRIDESIAYKVSSIGNFINYGFAAIIAIYYFSVIITAASSEGKAKNCSKKKCKKSFHVYFLHI